MQKHLKIWGGRKKHDEELQDDNMMLIGQTNVNRS